MLRVQEEAADWDVAAVVDLYTVGDSGLSN